MAGNSNETHIGGKEHREIVIVPYNPQWPRIFQYHQKKIVSCLGSSVKQIEHVGSTSVPGLAAKPIIDMLLILEDSSSEESYLPAMQHIGYELRIREPDWFEHRMLRTKEKDVHIHVFSQGCSEIDRMIAFRNHLRKHDSYREAYAHLKRELAARDWDCMDDYARAKTQFIESITSIVR